MKTINPSHPDLVFNEVPVFWQQPEFLWTWNRGYYQLDPSQISIEIKESVGESLVYHINPFQPRFDYENMIYHNQSSDLSNLIEQVQYKNAFIVSGCWQETNHAKL